MRSDDLIIYFIGYAIAFIIGIFITRAVFSIPKRIRLQEAQLHMLTEIARANHVKEEVIKTIYTYSEIRSRVETNSEQRESRERARMEKEKK